MFEGSTIPDSCSSNFPFSSTRHQAHVPPNEDGFLPMQPPSVYRLVFIAEILLHGHLRANRFRHYLYHH